VVLAEEVTHVHDRSGLPHHTRGCIVLPVLHLSLSARDALFAPSTELEWLTFRFVTDA
jgi:hypothetical protein